MIQQHPLKLDSENKQSQRPKLEGFWAEDVWDMRDCPIDLGQKKKQAPVYRFEISNSFFKQEFKEVFYYQLVHQEWSIGNNNLTRALAWIVGLLNSRNIRGHTLLACPIDFWVDLVESEIERTGDRQNRFFKRADANQVIKKNQMVDTRISLIRRIYEVLVNLNDDREEFEKDRWNLNRIMPQAFGKSAVNILDFKGIAQDWLRSAAKKYIRYRSTHNGRGQLKVDLQSIEKFSESLQIYAPAKKAQDLNRDDILNFISYLVGQRLSNVSRGMFTAGLKNFLEMARIEQWEGISERMYFLPGDFPKREKPLPRALPDEVLSQLIQLEAQFPKPLCYQLKILLQVGMRISELLTLPFDCLIKDHVGDFFLRYYQSKMKKEHSVPISKEVANVILAHQSEVVLRIKKAGQSEKPEFLFASPRGGSYHPSTFRHNLNLFAAKLGIKDNTGKAWRFEPHQFRHTVGTQMINNGVSQHHVQKYLGHETPEMTSRYAHVTDQTLKSEFAKYHGKLIDINGRVLDEVPENQSELQWLKKNIVAQSLPNGYCGLPATQSNCQHAAACLSCAHFRTDASFLPVLEDDFNRTCKVIEDAEKKKCDRIIDVNTQRKEKLNVIITSLKKEVTQ